MLVSEFGRIINNLSSILQDGGARKTVITDLASVEAALQPFKEKNIAQFAEFLRIAAEYQRTGIVPAAGKPSRKAKPVDSERVNERAQRVLSLCEAAMSGAATEEEIMKLSADLNKESAGFLKALALQLNIGNSKITKGNAIAEVVSLIRGRMRTHMQVSAINS